MRQAPYKLRQILEPVINAMGYELVGIEFQSNVTNALLRVYIDNSFGISIDDCERVSHQVSGVLDVEDPISGHYTLEVSSPGLDRPLFEAEHFARFAGFQAYVQLDIPLNGRRKFRGRLKGLNDSNEVVLEIENETLSLPLDRIEKARLIPEFQVGAGGRYSA